MKKRIASRQTPLSFTVDLVTDTARLLQRVGVVQIDESTLDDAVHGVIKGERVLYLCAEKIVTKAAELFVNRNQQGFITLEQLLGTLRSNED